MDVLKPVDGAQLVVADRKRRAEELAREMKALAKHKRRIQSRQRDDRDWPIDAVTGGRADVLLDDVRAPLPDDRRTPSGNVDEKMQALRAEANGLPSFSEVDIDPGVAARRR